MIETILNSMQMGSLPAYGLMIVSTTVMTFLAIKLLLLAKAATKQKKPREWVFIEERDENGMPVLATAKVRSSRTSVLRTR